MAKSAPDGYTLLFGTNSTFSVNPTLFPKVPYDTLRDFAPVAVTVMTPHVLLVHPSLPVDSVKALIALAKAQPGKLNYASSGNGSAFHLGMELLKATAGVKVIPVDWNQVLAKKADWTARWKNDVIGSSGKQLEVVKPK